MGGSSSRELSRRGSKRRRQREQSQWSGQQNVLPTEHSPDLYEDSGTRHFSYDAHDAMTYMESQTGFYQCQENHREEFTNCFDMPRDFYTGNRNSINNPNRPSNNNLVIGEEVNSEFGVHSENRNGFRQRPSPSANDKYEERQFRRPIRRHHSFNENRFRFQSDQGPMKGFCSSRIRCSSLIDLNDRGFMFEGQYMENRFTNFSNCNLPIQNHHFGRSSPFNSSTYDAQTSVCGGGIKRNSCASYNDDVIWDDGSNCEEMLLFDSPVKPRVKRRQSDESQSIDFLSDNRSENERSHSGLSFHSNESCNSEDNDNATSLPHEACGALDILSFPSEWSSCAVDKTGYVSISASSPEGQSVQRFFQRTCRSKDFHLSISGIIRIENPFLHTLYLLKKEEMTVRNGHVDELYLYHGTKKTRVLNICENNLDWRQYSEMHRFGKGVSFSPSAIYSSHYSDDRGCDKILMLFKVLVSKSILGLPEMNIPVDDGVPYDTSIKEDASVIVKYNDNEFYPLYKILYNSVKVR